MAQRDELEPAVFGERFVEIEDEVPGDAEYVPYALGVDLVEENLVKFQC